MSLKLRLVDITKLQKSNYLASEASKAAVREAKLLLDKQEAFMKNGGMDRQKLRAFINSDYWTSRQKQKAREELLNFHKEFKNNMVDEASAKRKELSSASSLLSQRKVKKASTIKKRSGYV
ncbi:hypothetical protein [Endozoicomonas sp. SCSIO W0465]|uniref:hypothetical protein n=1 Tax=Endozoicomonas sp. SCSIO W0465 TaxID=2918516 RepID=UPI002075CF8E|nr:hypothetical protein [Endozoicomonas sp. SCSIO W0465]USE35386.1 hypothetical protein MJO57_25315 [Endozoicomonas sp. SCSIO W0465]